MGTVYVIYRVMFALFALSIVLRVVSFQTAGRKAEFGRYIGLACLVIAVMLAPIEAWMSWSGHDWIEDGDGIAHIATGVVGTLAFVYTWLTRQTDTPGRGLT